MHCNILIFITATLHEKLASHLSSAQAALSETLQQQQQQAALQAAAIEGLALLCSCTILKLNVESVIELISKYMEDENEVIRCLWDALYSVLMILQEGSCVITGEVNQHAL
jgi:hypothetical protein